MPSRLKLNFILLILMMFFSAFAEIVSIEMIVPFISALTSPDLVFNNINKWSPADIYLASAKAQRLLKTVASGKDFKFKLGRTGTTLTSIDNFKSFAILNACIASDAVCIRPNDFKSVSFNA